MSIKNLYRLEIGTKLMYGARIRSHTLSEPRATKVALPLTRHEVRIAPLPQKKRNSPLDFHSTINAIFAVFSNGYINNILIFWCLLIKFDN